MNRISTLALDLIDLGYKAGSAPRLGELFFEALQPYGVRAIYARGYANEPHCDESVFSRISPPGWESFYADERFADINYLTREVSRRDRPFAWSDIELNNPAEIRLQQALIENGFPDGLAAPCHGPGYVGVTSLAFAALDEIAPAERAAIELASLVLHNRMRDMMPRARRGPARPRISRREHDCLAFLAEGRTDAEIADRLGISETTVITHLQNARRKLGARNRTQAVALAISFGILSGHWHPIRHNREFD